MSDPVSSSLAPEEPFHAFGEQLQSLTRRVEFLEAKTATQTPPPDSTSALAGFAARGAEFALELFSCAVRVQRDCDPESPGYCWYNVCVSSDATHDELRELRRKWYERIASLELSDPTVLRLLVFRAS